MVKTDGAGHILKGRFITISREEGNRASFRGTVRYRGMKGESSAASLVAEGPVVDGGDLPPVIVTASYGSGGISYADWYNLLEMAGDGGSAGVGYYTPAGGGGGGGAASAPTVQVDFEAPESKDAVDISKYMKCFGLVADAGATYTVTICVDLPVDNDPSKIFNWSDASPGHTFIELYKNGTGGLVKQDFGFYPDMPWKTVSGASIDGKVADDGGHEYQAKYTISVSASGFASAVRTAQAYGAFDYNVATFNCADYSLKVFTAAGGQLSVPQFPVPGYSDASNTPQGVYDAIQGLVLAGNKAAMANGQKQWQGESHGACN